MPVDLFFSDGSSVDSEMRSMTMSMIVSAVPEFKFTHREKRCRCEMLEKVAVLPIEMQNKIQASAKEKLSGKLSYSCRVLDEEDCVMGVANDVGLEKGEGSGSNEGAIVKKKISSRLPMNLLSTNAWQNLSM